MPDQNSKRKNRKLQVIDLSAITFEFSDHNFTLSGFVANDGKQWFSAQIACDNLGLKDVSRATSRLPYKDKAIVLIARNGRPVRYLSYSNPHVESPFVH